MIIKKIYIIVALIAFVAVFVVISAVIIENNKNSIPVDNSNHKYENNESITDNPNPNIPEIINFSEIDMSSIDKVVISDCSKKNVSKTIIDKSDISKITSAVSEISATDPVSNRGYYGSYYVVTMYDGADIVLDFTLAADNAVIYGEYETVSEFTYGARYICTDVTTHANCVELLGEFFN